MASKMPAKDHDRTLLWKSSARGGVRPPRTLIWYSVPVSLHSLGRAVRSIGFGQTLPRMSNTNPFGTPNFQKGFGLEWKIFLEMWRVETSFWESELSL